MPYLTSPLLLTARFSAACREKDALWKKSDKLEFKQRMRAQVWADSETVLNCADCGAAFGFMLRKVHVGPLGVYVSSVIQ